LVDLGERKAVSREQKLFQRKSALPLLARPPLPDGSIMATELGVVEGGIGADPAPAKKYRASIYPKSEVDPDFVQLIFAIEKALDCKIWCLVQQGEEGDDWNEVGHCLYSGFLEQKAEIIEKERVGLLIHSPGGQADCAYKIVRLFQRRTDGFFTIVPLVAKSAATLMAIGGKEILMGSEAELGPLDVQIWDEEKDEYDSALNAVQSFERLNAYGLTALDHAVRLLMTRTRKKPLTVLPYALQYATSILGPLADKIDTIDLTRKSRELKVAADYAVRVMRQNYTRAEFTKISNILVERYSTHGFVIDRTEAGPDEKPEGSNLSSDNRTMNLGLHVSKPNEEIEELFTQMRTFLVRDTIIGRIVEQEP
jgi:hypothetical protein